MVHITGQITNLIDGLQSVSWHYNDELVRWQVRKSCLGPSLGCLLEEVFGPDIDVQ